MLPTDSLTLFPNPIGIFSNSERDLHSGMGFEGRLTTAIVTQRMQESSGPANQIQEGVRQLREGSRTRGCLQVVERKDVLVSNER